MGQDQFGPDNVEREEVESRDVETTDGAWQDSRGRGGARWLLLVIPVVALVVLQLQPGGEPSAVSTPTKFSAATKFSSPSSPAPTRSRASAMSNGQPVVQNLGHPLLGADQDWELYARGDRAVVRVQMARGRVTTTPVPALASSGPIAFVVTAAGALVRPLDFVAGYLVPAAGPAQELTGLLGQGGPVVPGPDPDHLWVETGNLAGGSIQLVTLAGRPAPNCARRPTRLTSSHRTEPVARWSPLPAERMTFARAGCIASPAGPSRRSGRPAGWSWSARTPTGARGSWSTTQPTSEGTYRVRWMPPTHPPA